MSKFLSLVLTSLGMLTGSMHAYALPFSVVPKSGTVLPTTYNGIYPTVAYYTVTNNTHTRRIGNLVRSLPQNAVQVRTNGTYPDTCGGKFTLAPNGQKGDSCTLELNILGAIDGNDLNPDHLIFVCFPGEISCTGATPQLNVAFVDPWKPLSVAYEIINIANAGSNPRSFVQTYKAAGSNPVPSDAAWNAFIPPTGYTKNTTRYLQFNEEVFLASPGEPVGSTTYITTGGTPPGYTWGALSNAINAMWPYDSSQYPTSPSNLGPFEAGNFTTTPPAGVVKVTANYKAQMMKFYANENDVRPGTPGAVPILRFFVVDPWGNEYIMHASSQDNPADVKAAFDAAILPPGFKKISRYLKKDFILRPATGPDNAFEYTLLRDNENNTYHQTKWDHKGITIASRIQKPGMPIWGGRLGNTIRISKSFNNTIYGGGGKNLFIFLKTLTGGTNTIMDFNVNGDKLDFQGQTYNPVVLPSGIKVELANGANVLLSGIFYFDDSWVLS